jgi:hypothetical protein
VPITIAVAMTTIRSPQRSAPRPRLQRRQRWLQSNLTHPLHLTAVLGVRLREPSSVVVPVCLLQQWSVSTGIKALNSLCGCAPSSLPPLPLRMRLPLHVLLRVLRRWKRFDLSSNAWHHSQGQAAHTPYGRASPQTLCSFSTVCGRPLPNSPPPPRSALLPWTLNRA